MPLHDTAPLLRVDCAFLSYARWNSPAVSRQLVLKIAAASQPAGALLGRGRARERCARIAQRDSNGARPQDEARRAACHASVSLTCEQSSRHELGMRVRFGHDRSGAALDVVRIADLTHFLHCPGYTSATVARHAHERAAPAQMNIQPARDDQRDCRSYSEVHRSGRLSCCIRHLEICMPRP